MYKSIALLATAICLASCVRVGESDTPLPPLEDGASARLHISIPGPDTKSVTGDELSSLQILIYDDSGILENGTYSREWNGGLDFTLSVGQKTLCLVANAPELRSVGSLNSLRQITFDYSENIPASSGGILMTTSVTKTVTAGDNTCSANLSRRASRIVLAPVDISGMNSALAAKVSFRAAFLINVRSRIKFDGQEAATAGSYLYKAGCDSGGRPIEALSGNGAFWWNGLDCVISGDLTSEGATLLCFANNFDGQSADYAGTDPSAFSVSRTRLVVEAVTDSGEVWYYPVSLPAPLRDNYSYEVHLSVSGPGSDHPNVAPEYDNYSASLVIKDWTGGATYTEIL